MPSYTIPVILRTDTTATSGSNFGNGDWTFTGPGYTNITFSDNDSFGLGDESPGTETTTAAIITHVDGSTTHPLVGQPIYASYIRSDDGDGDTDSNADVLFLTHGTGVGSTFAAAQYPGSGWSMNPGDTFVNGLNPTDHFDGGSWSMEAFPGGTITTGTTQVYDMIRYGGPLDPSNGMNLTTAGGDLISVDEPLVFNTINDNQIGISDTVTIGSTVWTVTDVGQYDLDVTYNGGGSNLTVPGWGIELSNGTDTFTYFAPNDNTPLPDITAIIPAEVVGGGTVVPKADLDANNNVTLDALPTPDPCILYDFIQTNQTLPVFGDVLTQAASELVEVDEPIQVGGGDPSLIEVGDSLFVGADTYSVTQVAAHLLDVTYDGGASFASNVRSYAIEVTNGTDTFTYYVPWDNSFDLADITQIEVKPGLIAASAADKSRIDNDDVVTLDGVVPPDPCTVFDFIQTNTPMPGGSATLTTAANQLEEIDEPVQFGGGSATTIEIGDTVFVGSATFTVTATAIQSIDITYNGGSSFQANVSSYAIEVTDGTDTFTYYVPRDVEGDFPNITQIETGPFIAVAGLDKADIDQNDTVTLDGTVAPDPCFVFDFIQTNQTMPNVSDSLTQAAGELVEVDEPIQFGGGDPSLIEIGDTMFVGGATYDVTQIELHVVDMTYNGGSSFASGVKTYAIEVTDGTDTFTYYVPMEDGTNNYPNITQIDVIDTIDVATGDKVLIDEDDNVTLICFAEGTQLATSKGDVEVEKLTVGDKVLTADNGYQRIRWIGKRTVKAEGDLAPIVLTAGTFGLKRDLKVSPQHRVLIQDWRAELLFEEQEVLVAAKALVNGETVYREAGGEVTYYHVLFDHHEIIFSEGIATESFHPGQSAVNGLAQESRVELFALFPELENDVHVYGPSARKSLKAYEYEAIRAVA